MGVFPAKNETLVSSYNIEEVVSILNKRTHNIKYEEVDGSSASFLFQGVIGKNSFRISKKTVKPENFNPILIGKIEATSHGSILFLKYRLMPSTKMFFAFWTTMALALGFYFLFAKENILHAGFAFLLGLGNYLITVVNFNMHSQKARKALSRVLNDKSIH
ncbi:hypothetical protein [Mangrovivirga cuniculi]|uniref:Uncharacterized protein n=1 Tax=Mangrovivirga cuniculi TaxID=2715131 RepID=A0A4D7JDD0_9BACT|nr:hypothetical protein [Mangrovivirga cuniculi]QCK13671.1 hypothetical protein DCC35_02325 [Mangrovivirga cuniculi]